MKRLHFLVLFVLAVGELAASLPQKVGITYPSQAAFVMGSGEQLSGQQFQTDGILTYKGYQYTVYYNSTRNVCIARRKMPVGSWEEVVLPHINNENDAHNTISMGISTGDGRIHLSYDHHNDLLNYCYSVQGSANEPEKMPWSASSFSETTNIMDRVVPDVTYPRFISKPDGNLLFECRFRLSGYGDSYLREYDSGTQTWSLIGRYVQGEDVSPDACAYINGMTYDSFGRLHVTWCWRDDFGGGTNHDFYYAYSEDHGRTWKDSRGDQKASVDVMNPTLDKVTRNALGQTKKTYMVEAIPYNRGYINQETQDVDSRGRIHAVNSHIPDGQASDANWGSSRTKARLHHRFRKEDGTWVKRLITVNGNSVNSTRRVHLAIDSYDNAYVVANGYGVLMASPDNDYATWTLVSTDGRSGYLSEPLVDRPLLRNQGVLSFVYLSTDQKIAVFDYLTKNPSTSTGSGLLAEYFSGENFSGLLASEVVASTLSGTIPAGTKSIRWSGTFETREADKYSLHLTTVAPSKVYVNDKLETEIGEGSNETTVNYSTIASHKNNLVIETIGSAAVSLAWSSASTARQNIPQEALYPELTRSVAPPLLPGKAQLTESLLAKKKEINSSTVETQSLTPFNPDGEYSVEVKASVQSAVGRGLDIETRATSGKGFRFSLEPGKITNTSILSEPVVLANVDNSREQVYRFAVKDDNVYVYQQQHFLGSTGLTMIGDIQPDNSESVAQAAYGNEKMSNWAGPSGAGTGKPTDYGWSSSSASIPWNFAGYAGGVRYEDVTHALDGGGSFTGRLMTIRWDAGAYSSASYFYPVSLEANTNYELSFLYEYWANASSAQPLTVGVSTSANVANQYASKSFQTTAASQRLRKGEFRFSSKAAGTYYLTFEGAYAMYGIGDFSLKSVQFENRLQFGKNYTDGLLSANVMEVSYEGAAYAPELLSSQRPGETMSNVTIRTSNNQLHINNLPAGALVNITDISGRLLLYQKTTTDALAINLNTGIYIIGINDERTKVIL